LLEHPGIIIHEQNALHPKHLAESFMNANRAAAGSCRECARAQPHGRRRRIAFHTEP
jgi:hypothetical protein